MSERAGRYVTLEGRIRTFIPKPLPPDPAITADDEYVRLLSIADRSLGRLDGVTRALPNPDMFVYMYVRKEAVLSSQIEGTQSTLVDLLEFEAGAAPSVPPQDVGEVANYVTSLNGGLARIRGGAQFDLDLIQEIHGKLLEGTRGGDYQPGRFRDEQVWIGYEHCPIEDADFVPPPPLELPEALSALEHFINAPSPLPLLTRAGLLHAQFETIHPFIDGNGRIGRMLVTLLLTKEAALHQPLLYLSFHFRQHRQEYCDRLQAIRDSGDWESWLKFFLRGVADVSARATETANRLSALRENNRTEIQRLMGGRAGKALTLLESLYARPIVSIEDVRRVTQSTFPTASSLVAALESLGILRESTGQRHYRRFAYRPYLDILTDTDSAQPSTMPVVPRSGVLTGRPESSQATEH
jgi:Fic family protein